jgi:glutamate formiminotransferase
MILECVVNISEGRDERVLAELAATAAPALLDVHRDPHHHRSVFTLAGPVDLVTRAARDLTTAAVARLDLSTHTGVHPRLGVVDVVPFIAYRSDQLSTQSSDRSVTVPLRDAFATWLGTLGVPSFLYGPLPGGPDRSLPDIRRRAFVDLFPDHGPGLPHPSAGATAVGARGVLVAYNVWVSSAELARTVAPLVRSPAVRALGLAVGERAQVSCNLVDPDRFGPAQLYDAVATHMEAAGGTVIGAELVGLIPRAVLHGIAPGRWAELGLSEEATLEARLEGLTA